MNHNALASNFDFKRYFSKTITLVVYGYFLYLCLNLLKTVQTGKLRYSWGFSEYLTNYSQGFTRRGFSGSTILFLNSKLGIDPYFLVIVVTSLAIFMNLFLFVRTLKTNPNTRKLIPLLLAIPTLFMAPLNDETMFLRKDWIIFLYIIALAINLNLLIPQGITLFTFTTKVFIAMNICGLLILTHEAAIIVLPICYEWIKTRLNQISTNTTAQMKKVLLISLAFPFSYFFFAVLNHGDANKSRLMVDDIIARFNIDPSGLSSNGWEFHQSFNLALQMFKSPITLLSYFLLIIVGPGLILIIGILISPNKWKSLVSSFLLPLPLFVIGWDWGRWTVFMSFLVLAQILRNVAQKEYNSVSLCSLSTLKIMLLLPFLQLLLFVPGCCIQNQLPFKF